MLVGTSGSAGERLVREHGDARAACPRVTLVIAGGSAVKAIGVWPPSVELTASAALLNGTVTRSRRYLQLEQLAGEMRGRAGGGLREAVLAGIGLHQLDQLLERLGRELEDCAEITFGEAATSVTGAKSLIGS